MEISPWLVYWVMQLDNVMGVVSLLSGLVGIALTISSVIYVIEISGTYSNPDTVKAMKPIVTKLSIAMCFLFTLCAFIPRSKTMCAVIAIPAVVNNETLQRDATDIYTIGMDRLREELGIEEDKPVEDQE